MAISEAHKKASAKWQSNNNEFATVKLRKGIDPSKEEIKAAAAREGLSVNAWLIEAIREKL